MRELVILPRQLVPISMMHNYLVGGMLAFRCCSLPNSEITLKVICLDASCSPSARGKFVTETTEHVLATCDATDCGARKNNMAPCCCQKNVQGLLKQTPLQVWEPGGIVLPWHPCGEMKTPNTAAFLSVFLSQPQKGPRKDNKHSP